MFYGDTGTFKTTELMECAKYIWEKTGRRMRMVSAEMASTADIARAYMEAGMVEVHWLTVGSHPRAELRKLARGEWKYVVSKLNPSVPVPREKWAELHAKGQAGIAWLPTPDEDWAQIGAYAWEGATSIAELLLLDVMGNKTIAGQDSTGMAAAGYTEDGEYLGGASKSMYNAGQQDVLRVLKESPKQLYDASKGKVIAVFFIAHESKGIDELTKVPMFGPALIGSAATNKVPKDVGTLIHFEARTDQKSGAKMVVAYFQDHPDSENAMIKWKAKPRIPATVAAQAEVAKLWPQGCVPLTLNPPSHITDFLRVQDRLTGGTADGLREWMQEVREGK
jgi:hypothetical protein